MTPDMAQLGSASLAGLHQRIEHMGCFNNPFPATAQQVRHLTYDLDDLAKADPSVDTMPLRKALYQRFIEAALAGMCEEATECLPFVRLPTQGNHQNVLHTLERVGRFHKDVPLTSSEVRRILADLNTLNLPKTVFNGYKTALYHRVLEACLSECCQDPEACIPLVRPQLPTLGTPGGLEARIDALGALKTDNPITPSALRALVYDLSLVPSDFQQCFSQHRFVLYHRVLEAGVVDGCCDNIPACLRLVREL